MPKFQLRSIAALGLLAVGLCLASCGGSDAEQPAASEREQVVEAVQRMYGAVADADAAGVCDSMLTSARDEVAQNVLGGTSASPTERTCEESMSKFLTAAAASGVLDSTSEAEVADVEVDGPVATATVQFGGPPGEVTLREEDGEWRFGADAMAPGGARPQP